MLSTPPHRPWLLVFVSSGSDFKTVCKDFVWQLTRAERKVVSIRILEEIFPKAEQHSVDGLVIKQTLLK